MKALSIQQPWAWLITHGLKDVENRDRPLPKAMVGQRIYVHAGLRLDECDVEEILSFVPEDKRRELHVHLDYLATSYKTMMGRVACPEFGAIVGEVTITGCVTESDSPWFCGPFGFTLADPVAYEKPIPMKGTLGFWEVEGVAP